MLDPRFVEEHPEVVQEAIRRRGGASELIASVDAIVSLGGRRRELIQQRDELRATRNRLSRQIGKLMREGRCEEAEQAKAEVQAGSTATKELEFELAEIEASRAAQLLSLPNLPAPDVPDGRTEEDNPVVSRWGSPPSFEFEPQAHVEIGEGIGGLDLERAARLTGARFAVLRGGLARMERALINLYLDVATGEHGYTELMVPYIVHRHVLEGTGQLPKFEEDLFKLEGKLNGSDAFLIPTAEVPVTNLHREEILEEEQLPLRYAAFTPCFRSEAGSAGRDVRGIIRQHQFHKVELVWITTPEQSEQAHEELVGHAEAVLQRLGLPYRKVLHCAGELSFAARRCYDLEVWLPSQGRYREISSVSNFGDFQARRMRLRYRPTTEDGSKARTRLAHTLNGSGLAVGRTLVAILENNQQSDGSVIIPSALRPYMGGLDHLEVDD